MGLTFSGMDVLQSYVDGDVQSAAILSSSVCPQRFKDRRAERWLESYRDLLDTVKLYYHRVGLDIERGQILHEAMQNGDMNGFHDKLPFDVIIVTSQFTIHNGRNLERRILSFPHLFRLQHADWRMAIADYLFKLWPRSSKMLSLFDDSVYCS